HLPEHERAAVAREAAGGPVVGDERDAVGAGDVPEADDAAAVEANGRDERRVPRRERDVADAGGRRGGAGPAAADGGGRSAGGGGRRRERGRGDGQRDEDGAKKTWHGALLSWSCRREYGARRAGGPGPPRAHRPYSGHGPPGASAPYSHCAMAGSG